MNNYYKQIKELLTNNEITKQIKNYSINKSDLITYYNIRKILNEAGNKYGEKIIEKYSYKLINEVNKKYNKSTLFKMKKFYLIFSNKKVAPLVPQLSWSHCLLLIPMKNIDKINYYINQTAQRNLSKRNLQEIIKSNEYERLPDKTKLKLKNSEYIEVNDIIKNPIVIYNPSNIEVLKEKTLQKLILENIESFLEELGNGFTFIKSEYKIKIGNSYNYIDLLLFNIEYNCYIVIELKITELKKEYIGQIEIYMNYIDNNIKKIHHNNTIGIIICRKENKFIIEYTSDKRILSREYLIKK